MAILFSRSFNALLAGYSFLYSSVTGKPLVYGMPPAIGVELTNHCNLNCPECNAGSGLMTRKRGFMDMNLFDKIISELKPYIYYLTLNFQGESMIHPQFFSFIRKSRKINTIVSTNGHFLSAGNAVRIVESGLKKLIVSLDGMDQDIYSSYRVNGNLATVIEGIHNVHKANIKAGNPLKLEIQFLINRINENQIKSARHLARELRASFRLKSMQIINEGTYKKWIPSQNSYSRYREIDGKYSIKNSWPNRCARLWLNPVITWEGNVLPCCFDKNAEYIMGDLNEDTFREIWNSPRYKMFRKSLLARRHMTDICRNCSSGLWGVNC